MRAWHPTEDGKGVTVVDWPCGTPTVLMYVGNRRYFRDITLSPGELLEMANKIPMREVANYLFALQTSMDRTNGVVAHR